MQSDFESAMRKMEYFHGLQILPQTWTVLRLDGRGFSKFTDSRFQKPFDEQFHALMLKTASKILEDFGAIYGYTESDEISLLFPPEWDLFDRELEKVISVSAGVASAEFTLACGESAHFDSRVWLGPKEEHVVDYFRWRQEDAGRCALNGWCYWTLRNHGSTARQATKALEGKGFSFKNELLFEHGINFTEVPAWQRRGSGILWQTIEREGFNPKTQEAVVVNRRQLTVEENLPRGDDYKAYLLQLMQSHLERMD